MSDAPPNLVARDFRAGLPNFLWLTDVTEFRLPAPGQPKVYLSPVLDCFDGGLASWSISTSPDAELANSSLARACATLSPGEAPWVHSDRGGHYRWPGWIAICEEHGLTRSMSAKGCSPDNSACEGVLRQAQERVLPLQGLGRGHRRGVHGQPRRVAPLL